MIRLIGFDLDGTLLTDDKRVTPRTRAVLASCAARGIALVPVTGRPFSAIPGEVLALPGVRYAAAASGADIRDLLTGEILNRDVIPTATALTILRALEEAETVNAIVIAAREEDILPFSELCKTYGITKPVKIVLGGKDREESVYRAALEADPQTEFLAVQDGARPLVTPELIDAVVTAAFRCNAAAPALPVRDTVKRREGDRVTETLDRASLAAVQTPQVFEASLLKAALQSAGEAGAVLTDDCSAVERLGKIVYLVDGDPENIKITTPLDLVLAEAILEDRRRRE